MVSCFLFYSFILNMTSSVKLTTIEIDHFPKVSRVYYIRNGILSSFRSLVFTSYLLLGHGILKEPCLLTCHMKLKTNC